MLWDEGLNDNRWHRDSDRHLIGDSLHSEGVSPLGLSSSEGESPYPSRADHVHSFNITNLNSAVPTMATGWSLISWGAVKVGELFLNFRINFQRTGGNLTVTSTGDLSNQIVATMDAACLGEGSGVLSSAVQSVEYGLCVGIANPNTGVITLTAAHSNITTGDSLSLSGLMLLV